MKTPTLRFAAAVVLCACAAELQALTSFDLPAMNVSAIKAAAAGSGETAEPAPGADTAAAKEWTVMVFMNAKNNLSENPLPGIPPGVFGEFSARDISEMQKVGTTASVNVVVEHGRKGKGSQRLLILKKESDGDPGGTVLGEYPDADMGDYKRVIDFIKRTKTAYPARRYMLVLWNHGLGWMDPDQTASKGILFDDDTKNYVRTKQLGEILRQAGYVDVLAMNACQMQMAEVAYEVKDNAGLLLASEENMLAQGFDYEKMLTFMNADPGFTDRSFSEFMMKGFVEFYAAGIDVMGMNIPLNARAGTLSTVSPAAVNGLPPYLDAFASAVMRNNETGAVKKAIETAVRFSSLNPQKDIKKMTAPYVDLYDFAAVTGANAGSRETRLAAGSLMGFIRSKLVINSVGLHSDTENGYDYTRVGGIAVNMTMRAAVLPPGLAGQFETPYSALSLSQNSQWDEFVSWCDGVWRPGER